MHSIFRPSRSISLNPFTKFKLHLLRNFMNNSNNNILSLFEQHHNQNDNYMVFSQHVNPFMMNQYLLACKQTKDAAIIDAGDSPTLFIQLSQFLNLNIKHLLTTHAHVDHIFGVNKTIKEIPNIINYLHPFESNNYNNVNKLALSYGMTCDKPPTPHVDLYNNQILNIGKLSLQVLHVPGHSPGHVAFYISQYKILFSGDLLFYGSIGRTDLPGSNHEKMKKSLSQILTLPSEVKVYPGHMEPTTIGREKPNFHLFF